VLGGAYVDRVRTHIPSHWALTRDDIWIHVRPEKSGRVNPVRAQGFKIHVSAAPPFAGDALDLVVPACVERGIDFKLVGDPALHFEMNSKRYGRAQSGKFMTIYPPDDAAFVELLECLHRLSKDRLLAGPRILSDRQYKDSRILFYRYGGIAPPSRVKVDGTHATYLTSPDGDQVIDERVPYFRLPGWVDDPFGGSARLEQQESVLLEDRYLIEGVFRFSNAGGVYYGTDTATQEPVVVKEGRPLTNYWSIGDKGWDAVSLLGREHELLLRLADVEFVPDAIDFFVVSDHAFLVERRIGGLNLRQYAAQDDVILAPFIRMPGRIALWAPKFKHLAEALLRMVRTVHERGILIGDLSPDNVFIEAESGRTWLIDFESAVTVDDGPEWMRYSSLWGTPGYVNPARNSRDRLLPEDDFFAVAMILYTQLTPAMLLTLNPAAMPEFLDRFVRLGVPAEVREVIVRLARGEVDEASCTLADWKLDIPPTDVVNTAGRRPAL
jgi:hypothetical protein